MSVLRIGASVYLANALFCAFGAVWIPSTAQHAMTPYLWLLGPPANLVWGTKFLSPFMVGTLALMALAYAWRQTQTRAWKAVVGVSAVCVWTICGLLCYAPGA